jgi:voltage-gated potassium channel
MLVLRSLVSVVMIVGAYFLLPLNRPAGTGIVVLVVGVLALAVVLAWQIRSIIGSPFPRLRAFETLAVGVLLLLITFAGGYYLISQGDPTAFSQPLDRVGALYFTITVFSTVGFGDITPVGELPRLLVSLQMLLDLVVFGLVAKLIFGAVEVNLRRRAASRAKPDPSAP